jgi:hypothetical protein
MDRKNQPKHGESEHALPNGWELIDSREYENVKH